MAALTAVVAVVLFAPAAVSGKPSENVEPGIVPVFTFPASHGYRAIGLASPAHSGLPARLLLIFARRQRSVTYVAPADVDEAGNVHAELAGLGEVDLHFVADGRVGHARSRCGGGGYAYSSGDYEGKIDFRGEEGYTRVAVERATLVPQFLLNVLCPGGGYGWSTPGPGGQLVAKRGSGRVAFKAIKAGPASHSFFSARINETHGRIHVSRYVSARGPATRFVFPRRGQVAHVSPPAPFSGAARLRGSRWRGSLAVDFPGHSGVGLGGSKTRARLLHARFSGSIARGLE